MLISNNEEREKVEELLLLNWKLEDSNFGKNYTKSHYFLLPLFGLERDCKKEFNRHYLNTFIDDEEKPCHIEDSISVAFQTTDILSDIESITWERLKSKLIENTNYKYHYYVGNDNLKNICIFVFKIQEKFLSDYRIILSGKYSKTSKIYRETILRFFIDDSTLTTSLVGIFRKQPWVKKVIEDKFNLKDDKKEILINKSAEYYDIFLTKGEIFRNNIK